MKRLYQFSILLLALTFALDALAWDPWFELTHDGINYRLYYSGSRESIQPLYAQAIWGNEGISGSASIAPSVSYDYTYIVGYDEFGDPIYRTIKLTAEVTSLYKTFMNCTGLTSVNIPNTVTSIDGMAFEGCIGLTSIDIPNSVTLIGTDAFWRSGLISIIIPNSVTTISSGAFGGCDNLKSVTLSNSLASIPNSAFKSCDALTEIVIPNSVTKIGDEAFYWCNNLNKIVIGNSVTNIGAYAFHQCNSLSSVTCLAENPPRAQVSSFYNYSTATLYVPGGSLDKYKTAFAWEKFYHIEPIEHEYTVTLDKSSVTIPKLSTVQLHATVTPDDEYTPTVEWSSSNPGIASVTSYGLVKGSMPGTATITASAGQSSATCVVTVTPIFATDIALNSYQEEMEIGEIFRLVATVYPGNVSNGNVSWSIPQNDVISCSWNGNECLILAEKSGTVTVTATTTDGTNLSASCVINVKPSGTLLIPVESITLNKTSMKLKTNAVQQLIATVLPENASNKAVAWSSSNTAVATVDNFGIVTTHTTGTATITATTVGTNINGDHLSAKCYVTVISSDGGGDDILRGDVDGDGSVNISDVTTLIDYLLSGNASGVNLEGADCDQDGSINISDVTALIDYLLSSTWN